MARSQPLVHGQFFCHKTVDYASMPRDPDTDEGLHHGRAGDGEAHCAGTLILLEKMGRPSQMMRIA
jgi:hypothetical protein